MSDKATTLHVAPNVLVDLAREAALAVPGVSRLESRPLENMERLLGRSYSHEGIHLQMNGRAVRLHLHLVVSSDVSIPAVARQVQRDVARAMEGLAGIQLEALDITVEDVDFESPRLSESLAAK
ncbi:MAG: Asp23/Gls24 family envelope stress response protein [Chloroflexi bacterium]|nr:Asp23/Gls24 family envelope stress response protein [Chloroflexota bacterium]